MIHDPELAAAAYLDGELDAVTRGQFEAHMLDCTECWEQVALARRGRALAEALREPAPQRLRETARAIAALPVPEPAPTRAASGLTRRRLLMLGAAAAVTVAAPAAWMVANTGGHTGRHSDPLVAADAAFHDAVADSPTGTPPVARIGELGWRGSTQLDLAGYHSTGYRYTGTGQGSVLLVSCGRAFPRPANAVDLPGGRGWVVSMAHCTIVCTEHGGASWLSIADTREAALHAATAAGLAA